MKQVQLVYPLLANSDVMTYQWAPCSRIEVRHRHGGICISANRTGFISLARVCMTLATAENSGVRHDHLEGGVDLESGSLELTLALEGERVAAQSARWLSWWGVVGETRFDVSGEGGNLLPGEHVRWHRDADGLTIVASARGLVALARIFLGLSVAGDREGSCVRLEDASGLALELPLEIRRAALAPEEVPSGMRAWKLGNGEAWEELGQPRDAMLCQKGHLLMDEAAAEFVGRYTTVLPAADQNEGESPFCWQAGDIPVVDCLDWQEAELASDEGETWIKQYALNADAIRGHHIFRIAGDPGNGVYASQWFFESWLDAGLVGIEFHLAWDSGYGGKQIVFSSSDSAGDIWVDAV